MGRMGGLPDPDWYLDNVLVHAEPGSGARIVVGEADVWRAWWQTELTHVSRDHPELGPLAAAQAFAVTTRQLQHAGIPRHLTRRLVRSGHWSSPQPGTVSLVGPADADGADHWVIARRRHAVLCAGAVLANPGHVVSGVSAAVVHGLPTRHLPDRVQLTSASRANPRRGARAASLDPDDVTTFFGAAVTTPARTCVDLARHDRRGGLMAADAALRQSLVDRTRLDAALDRARQWPGIRQAREVLALADPRAESALESVTRLALHDDGFPDPEPQFRVLVAGRRHPLRVDFCWPQQRLILEADGRGKYVGDENWREKQREALLRPLGFRIERVIWSDVERTWPTTSAYLWAALGL